MKNIFLVFVLNLFFCCNFIFAQNDTHTDDSLQYNVPKQVNADLGLLIPPPCFVNSTAFNGYMCVGNGSAIIMQLIENISYLQATRNMNDDFFKTNGFTFISVFDLVSTVGLKGKVYKLSYVQKDLVYIRYMVFAGDLEKTIWLNITYPKVVEELMELEILKSLQTLSLNPADNEK